MPLTERQQMAFLLEMTAKEFKEETDKRKENNDEQENKKSAGSSKSELSKIHKRNKRGETPLHLAAIKGDIDSVQSLINKGADVNVTDHAGWSPLHEACSRGHYKIVKILLKAGADANAKGLEDDTPLHDACSNEHIKIVRILLKYGADPRKRNEDLETPLDLAASSEISDFLEEYLSLSDAEKEKFGVSVGSMELSSDDDYYGEENLNKFKEKDNKPKAKQIENDNDNNNKQEPEFMTKLNKDTYFVTDSSDDDSKSKSGSRTAEKCLVDENLDDDDDEGDFTPRKKKRTSNSFSKRILSDDEEDESLAVIRDGFAKEKKLRELEKASTLSEESTSKEQTIASQTVLGHTVTKFQGKQSTYVKDKSSEQREFIDEKKIEKLGPKKHRDSSSEEKTLKVQEHKKTKKKLLRSNVLKKDQKDLELGRKETVDAKEVQNVDTKRDDNDNVTLKKKRKESQGSDSKERGISGDKNKIDDLTQEGTKVNTEKHKKRKKLPNYALFEEEDPKKAKGHEKVLIRNDKKGKIENERVNDGKVEKKSPEKNKSMKEETVKPNKQNIDQIKQKKVVNKISPIKFSHELSESPFFLREEPMTGKILLAKKNKFGKKLQSDSDRKLKPLKTKRTSSSVSKGSGATIGKRKGRDSESEGSEKPIKKLKKVERVSESELSLHESSDKQTGLIGESNEVSENLQETKMATVVDVINSENISSDTESPDDNIRLIDLVVSKETKERDQEIDTGVCKKDDTTAQECTAQSSSAFNDNPYISDISDAENVDEDENLPKERMTNDMFRVNIFNQRLNQVPQQLCDTGAPPEAESKPDASFNDGSGSSSLAKPVPASDVTNQEARICSPLAKQEQMTDINSSDDKKASESPDKPAEMSDLPTSTEFCTIDNSNSIEINHSSSVRKDDELVPLADVKMLDTVEAGSSGISEGTEYSSDLSLRVMKSVELKKLNIEEDLEIKNSETERNSQSIEDNKTTTICEESVCKGNLDDMPPSVCYSTNNLDTKKGALAAISGYSSGEDEPSEDPCDASVLEPADSQVCRSEFENEKDSKGSVVYDIMNDPGSSSPVHPVIKTETVLSPEAAFYESGGEGSGTTSNDFPSIGQDTNDAFKIKDFEPLHKEQVKGENEPISDSESNLPVFCSKTREDMEELTAEKEEIPSTEYVTKENRLQEEENKLRDKDSQDESSEEYSQNKVCGEDSKDVLFEEEFSKLETAADVSVPVTEKESSSDSEDFGISSSYKPLPVIPPAVSCKEALSSIDGCRESTGTVTLETIVKVKDSDEKVSEILSNDEDKSAVKSKALTDDNEDAETTCDASFGSKSGINEGLNVANDATSMDTPELNVYMSEKHSLQNVEETENISKEAVCEVSRETVYSNKASIKTIHSDVVGECPSDNVEDQDSMQSLADAYMPNLFDKFGKEALRADTRESLVLDHKDNSATVVGSSPVKTADTSDDTFNATANQTATSTDKLISGDSSKLGTCEKEETNDGKEETIKQDVNLLATDIDHDLHLGPFHGTKFEESDVDLKELSHPEETLKMLTEGVRLHKAGDGSVSTYAKDREQITLSENIQEIQHVKRTYLTELSEEDKHIVNMSMEIAEKMNSSDMCEHVEDCLVNTGHAEPVSDLKPGRECEAAERVDSNSKADLDEGKVVDSAADVSNDSPAKSVEKRPVNDHRIGEELADEIERIKRNQSVEKPTNVVGDSRTSQEITTQDKELIDRNNQFSSDKGSRSNGARTVDIEPRGVPRVVADIDLHPIIPSVSVSNEQQRLTSESETAESSTVNKEKLPQAAKADDYENAASNLDAASNKLGDSQDNRMSDKNGKQARSASPNVPSRWREALFRSHANLQPQIPPSYHSFSMFTWKYQLDTEDTQENDDNVDEMKEMQQQHAFELEKLHIAMEQELLRVENKVQHASSNRKPISACSAVMYQTLEQYAKLGANGNVQPNNDATDIDELRKTWIQEVLEKYTKLEERVISRQKKEISCLEQQIAFDKLHLLGRKEVLRRKYLAGH